VINVPFLQAGFEVAVRARLGANAGELPDSDINNRYISQYAEAIVLKRVPDYASITDELDSISLENAVIAYICYLLCPSMARRVNIEVTTIDVKWKKDKMNWSDLAASFIADMEASLSQIQTVPVTGVEDYALGARANFQTAAE
jgi:hypothetical protein